MKMRAYVAMFVMVMSAIGIWCIYVVKMQQIEVREFNTIHPMDLTVTYCQSCSGCNTQQQLDALELEECLQEDLEQLGLLKGETICLL